MKNNVLILIQGREIAASRYRILQYIPYLESQGMVCHVREFPDTVREYIQLYSILPEYGSVFVQRKRFHFPFLALFRKRARRIVYDLDDAVMYKNSLANSPYSRTRETRFRRMAGACDVIIAGNTFLREKALAYNRNVEVIPSSIPVARYELKDYSIEKKKITIGWIGDHGSIHYLEKMKGVWDVIARKYPGQVELKIICDVFFHCEEMPVRKVRWSGDTEVEELKDMDIGVMPLLDDLWSWGKCGLKILQYYGVGIPAVCTPVGVNKDIVSPGNNGFWAMSKEEWITNLSVLVENADMRKGMGLSGRDTLEKGFTMEVNASRLARIILGESLVRSGVSNEHLCNGIDYDEDAV